MFQTEQEAASACAARIAEAVRRTPELVLGLVTGRSPLNVYRNLVDLAARGALDLSRATTFNVDEFLGLPPEDAGSFRAYMDRHLFRHVNLSTERIHFLDGCAPDAEAECARYDAALAAAQRDAAGFRAEASTGLLPRRRDPGGHRRLHGRGRLSRGGAFAAAAFAGASERAGRFARTGAFGRVCS
ncbi:6-phosphogluconolactonase [Corallococcus sp. 4LFB]|uniref:6-phosphogluconolactonase n=1 Tax=Corallococcus sp. 4LFB TaxID=3383249 RepID=UPI0039770AB2